MCRRSGETGVIFKNNMMTELGHGEAESTNKGTVLVNPLWVYLVLSAFKILE